MLSSETARTKALALVESVVETLTSLERRDASFCETAQVIVTCEMSGLQDLASLHAAHPKSGTAEQRLKEEILKCSGQIERPAFLRLASSLLSESQEAIWQRHSESASPEMIEQLTHLVELMLLRTIRIGLTQRGLGVARGLRALLVEVELEKEGLRNPLSQQIGALRAVLFSSRRSVLLPKPCPLSRFVSKQRGQALLSFSFIHLMWFFLHHFSGWDFLLRLEKGATHLRGRGVQVHWREQRVQPRLPHL